MHQLTRWSGLSFWCCRTRRNIISYLGINSSYPSLWRFPPNKMSRNLPRNESSRFRVLPESSGYIHSAYSRGDAPILPPNIEAHRPRSGGFERPQTVQEGASSQTIKSLEIGGPLFYIPPLSRKTSQSHEIILQPFVSDIQSRHIMIINHLTSSAILQDQFWW